MKKDMYKSLGDYQKGDWVRFYQCGRLVIAEIVYFYKETGGYEYAATDQGAVQVSSIFQIRR